MPTRDVVSIEFRSEAFRTIGEPPGEPINGQYGGDLCEWLCDALSDVDFHFGAEDWGWYVETNCTHKEKVGTVAHEIRIYDHGWSGVLDEPAWTVVVATSEKISWLKFFTKWQAMHVNYEFASKVFDHLRTVASGQVLAELVGMDSSGNVRGKSRPFVGNSSMSPR